MGKNTAFALVALHCALVLSLSSCTAGVLGDFLRTSDDPTIESPTVVSFATENAISISWSADPAADEFILQRAEDSKTPTFATIYQGADLTYTDSGLPSEKCYLYRLIKTRGSRTFDPSGAVFGVSASVRKDEFESNDTEDSATFLESDCISNMNYYKSYSGAELIDVDWYYVAVPPKRKALVNINEVYNPLSGNATHYRVLIPGREWDYVVQNINFELENPSNATQNMLLKIYPDPDHFSLTGGVGGQMVTYKISLNSIVQY